MRFRNSSAIGIIIFVTSIIPASGMSPQSMTSDKPLNGLRANRIISSDILGYDLQYRVFVPESTPESTTLPVLYVTDGEWYIENGEFPRLIQSMITQEQISPVIAVFTDNRDPHDLSVNRRNEQYFCNEEYVGFFREELIPEIESRFATKTDREHRTILGLSFGGLNSACFGLMANDLFHGIAMQSPAMHPIGTIHSAYQDSSNLDLKIFLSSGSLWDNEDASRKLRDILKSRGYELAYKEVPFGHSWENWKPLLDDVLMYYYGDLNSDE